jgi:prevent-host-death family protein
LTTEKILSLDRSFESSILVTVRQVNKIVKEKPMKRYSMYEARKNLTDIVSRVAYGGERITIGRRNKDLAVVVSLEDAELLERLEDEADIKAAMRTLKKGEKGIPWEKVKKELGLK